MVKFLHFFYIPYIFWSIELYVNGGKRLNSYYVYGKRVDEKESLYALFFELFEFIKFGLTVTYYSSLVHSVHYWSSV